MFIKSKVTAALFFKLIFWLRWVFVAALGLSLVVVCGLLIAVALLGVEHGSGACGLQQLRHKVSVASWPNFLLLLL